VLGGGILWHLQKFLQYIKYFYVKVLSKRLTLWHMSVVPSYCEAETGGSHLEVSPGRVSMRSCLKKQTKKAEGLGARLKW
jgi:hypothetical protein